ncbi:ergothioneine biosynthesis protein EgtB [Agarilytica rhodophyticola]|uniref:ergothioneine biosynthesis protein EgtB n=1 Tax=Agarilytica rhodophyticola TaxID=1737490 RepID=UPI000B345691|nr:ergothioneine biosynthesis protein EgtB [Agarilytica rhodophyticola]
MVVHDRLLDYYNQVRQQTVALTKGLSAEDLTVQSMPDASPGKWHLAHTSWFFETFILQKFMSQFQWFNQDYCYLFNSYYDTVGARHARPQRGLLTRPSLDEVLNYRQHVDAHMREVLTDRAEEVEALVTIGLHHEMQHQELFLTDVLHMLSHNPMHPAIISNNNEVLSQSASTMNMLSFDGGVIEVGALTEGDNTWQGFSYDCEQPRHKTLLQPFKLASRLVNNAEWIAFIEDGGYDDSLLWLSDGWARKNQEQWQAPLYWRKLESKWYQYGLNGLRELDSTAPVCHVSYYEAEAFARWQGKRLPREHEWELAAHNKKITGNFLEANRWRPQPSAPNSESFSDIYGDVWEWTQSAFSPYPGFDPKQGALGEYNGKFMSNQYVLKGGSCATPSWQMRASYRNFFYPHQRWQFTGVRLAEDI